MNTVSIAYLAPLYFILYAALNTHYAVAHLSIQSGPCSPGSLTYPDPCVSCVCGLFGFQYYCLRVCVIAHGTSTTGTSTTTTTIASTIRSSVISGAVPHELPQAQTLLSGQGNNNSTGPSPYTVALGPADDDVDTNFVIPPADLE